VSVIKLLLKTLFLKGIELQSVGLWCESACPNVRRRGGEEESCQKAQSPGLELYDDELEPRSLGRAMSMETACIHGLRDKDSDSTRVNVPSSHRSCPAGVRGLFPVKKYFWIEGGGC